ncbi:hypothetical protein POTOM_061709 [Populus tomentosa]|uniref:Uncharacterized protein n=1 Tax=Populus tomentosa TaxID=118781 RepID=A0A8X7XSP3_POPTO|nr:hypothetical protein POTOM_061709 [Populus tomentosa]
MLVTRSVLEQLTHRLDVMDKHCVLEEYGPFNWRGCKLVYGEGLGESYQPLDELTKKIKVDVLKLFGKLEPNDFKDWLTTIKDYFDWFAVLDDMKVHYA